MAEITCKNLETVLTKLNFRPGTLRYPERRDVTDQDVEIAYKWLDQMPQERIEDIEIPLTDEAAEFFALAEAELGQLKPEDVAPLRRAARDAIEDRMSQALARCGKLAHREKMRAELKVTEPKKPKEPKAEPKPKAKKTPVPA